MRTTKAILGLAALLLLPASAGRLLASDGGGSGGAGVLRFDEPQMTVEAGATTAVVRVERSDGHNGAVSVGYAAAAGTATAGVDFTPATGTLSWADGDETTKTFTVALLGSSGRAGKTVILTLGNPTGGAAILAARGQETLILSASGSGNGGGGGGGGDDGGGGHESGTGEIGFDEHDYVGLPAAGKAVITLERSSGSTGAVSVDYNTQDGTAVAGTDYTPAAGTLNWAAGDESLKTFFVPLLANGAGTVKLILSNPKGGATLSSVRNLALLSIGGPGHD
ncbi:MAG TPA: Calx-beta domain-containing protein, partial [Thermoanaerobaculia bacterium]|nr:Calx-beta domain-containing protein [Thermoanaerobaculia bacterium]